MLDHLLESSHRDDSNKWSNIGLGEEITLADLIEVHFTQLIWSSGYSLYPRILLSCITVITFNPLHAG